MSFLFGRKTAPPPTDPNKKTTTTSNSSVGSGGGAIGDVAVVRDVVDARTLSKSGKSPVEIGAYQPNNPYRDLLLMPYFECQVDHACMLDDERRFITGDQQGNLCVWDAENGTLLQRLDLHQAAISGIVKLKITHQFTNKMSFDQSSAVSPSAALTSGLLASQSNLVVVSGVDKLLSLWDTDSYKLITSIRCDQQQPVGLDSSLKDASNSSLVSSGSTAACRVFLNYENRYCICAGVDVRLYEVSIVNMLALVDELARDNRDCSVKHMIQIKNDKIAVATNSDVEIYGLVRSASAGPSQQPSSLDMLGVSGASESTIRLRELKRHVNAHKETILCLDVISDTLFASGSSDGHFIIYNSDSLAKFFDLKPFDELNQNQSMLKMSLTSIKCFRTLDAQFILICCGSNICIFDYLNKGFCFKLSNAHQSKITDLVLLNNQIATSAEDGTIRVWRLDTTIGFSLELVGECLGHSSSVNRLYTLSKNEIISTDLDNMLIIWRNSHLVEQRRNANLNKILSNIIV